MQTLMKHDLVDTFWLKIFPITLGAGKRLFAEGTIPAAFKVTESAVTSKGVIIVNYERAGAPPETDAISLPQPNLAFAWDAVYGEGFFVAHILGKKFGQGVFTGSQGTVLQVETLDGRNGVAVDNKGNT